MEILQNFLFDDAIGPASAHILNLFDTPFWKEHTSLSELVLVVEFSGDVRVVITHIGIGSSTVIHDETLSSDQTRLMSIPLDYANMSGLLAASFEVLDGAELISARYCGTGSTHGPVKVRYTVCTYNRPDYLQKNAQIFQRYIDDQAFDEPSRLTIINNGDPLSLPVMDNVDLVENTNLGGSGGFARGIYEVLHGSFANDDTTHIVLMDDDIAISKETFLRNRAILMFLKAGVHLGAGMMNQLAGPSRQKQINCIGHHFSKSWAPSDRDIGKRYDPFVPSAFSDLNRNPDSTGWWWHCFSVSDARTAGLPYPFFIKMDDVEYCLRLADHGLKLAIPLSLWVEHDDFDQKYSATMQYFRYRNRWILLALRQCERSGFHFVSQMWVYLITYIQGYRYEHATLLLMAVSDYLKGPDFLRQNYQQLLTEALTSVVREKAVLVTEQQAQDQGFVRHEPRKPTLRRHIMAIVTLRGLLSPVSRKVINSKRRVMPIIDRIDVRSILYFEPEKQCGYVVERDLLRMFKLLARACILSIRVATRYSGATRQYRETKIEHLGAEAWRRLFEVGSPPHPPRKD